MSAMEGQDSAFAMLGFSLALVPSVLMVPTVFPLVVEASFTVCPYIREMCPVLLICKTSHYWPEVSKETLNVDFQIILELSILWGPLEMA